MSGNWPIGDWLGLLIVLFLHRCDNDNALFDLTLEDPKVWFSIKHAWIGGVLHRKKSADEAGLTLYSFRLASRSWEK
jgi:hypothetical protein